MHVYALGILDAYSLALEKDPTFQAAIKEKEAGDEAKHNCGIAVVWSHRLHCQKCHSSDIFASASYVAHFDKQYRSYAGSVTLTQPLFDYEAYAKYKTGVAQSLMAVLGLS
jgi:protease secretion system outer membrane protein